MKYNFLLLIFFLVSVVVKAQAPRVPSVIQFADIKLNLHEHVRREIQEEVDALHRSQKYFNIKLDRVNLYFPIIERIFREEKVPDDFKYLVIQESALISDAISTSNAVGFWQFKIPSAEEVGLRVDRNVDERLNITASTYGAARYLKRNNFYFNNWLYALLSYNTGVGGAYSLVNEKYYGAKKMDLNRRTHWYIIKFLAHKIAFESAIDKGYKKRLFEYTDGGGQSLKQIAAQLGVDYNEMELYNKWLKRGKVPEDKLYAVIVPGLATAPVQVERTRPIIGTEDISFLSPNSNLYPKIRVKHEDTRLVQINGIPGIVANDGEDLKALALMGGLDLSKFLKINETDISHRVKGGEVYYYKSKKKKAGEHYHTVMPGENLWDISQKYGVMEQKLLVKNRLKDESEISTGMVLWLRYIRAEDQPVEYVQIPANLAETSTVTDTANELSGIQTQEDELPADETSFDGDEYNQIVEKFEEEPDRLTGDPDGSDVNEFQEGNLHELHEKSPLFHLVEAGETLYAISRKYKIPLNDILSINDLDPEDKISVGQKIYLRSPFEELDNTSGNNENSSSDTYMDYQVKSGDTMYSISKKYNVTVENILKWNNKSDFNLKKGEILKIKVSK